MFEQIEPKKVPANQAKLAILLAIVSALVFGFLCGRISAGVGPRLRWFDPDVLFTAIMFVTFTSIAFLICRRLGKPSRTG